MLHNLLSFRKHKEKINLTDKLAKNHLMVENLLSEFTPIYYLESPSIKESEIEKELEHEYKPFFNFGNKQPYAYQYQVEIIKKILEGDDAFLITAYSHQDIIPIHNAIDYITGVQNQSALYILSDNDEAELVYNTLNQSHVKKRQKIELLLTPDVYKYENYIPEKFDILITTAQYAHWHIISAYEKWQHFLERLDTIFVPNLHNYRNTYGTHMYSVLRRLLRVAEIHKSIPQIISTSYPIHNPRQLYADLTARAPTVIEGPTSQYQTRHLYICGLQQNKHLIKNEETKTISNFIINLVDNKMKCLIVCSNFRDANILNKYFANLDKDSRKQCELFHIKNEKDINIFINKCNADVPVAGIVHSQQVEHYLNKKHLCLDAVLYYGYPDGYRPTDFVAPTSNSYTPIKIFICCSNPKDQFALRNPHYLLDNKNNRVSIHPENNIILTEQLKCAANEIPLSPSELTAFGAHALDIAEKLDKDKEFNFTGGKFYNSSELFNPGQIYLNQTGKDVIKLMHNNTQVDVMNAWYAMQVAYPGAIIRYEGKKYEVQSFDISEKTATIAEFDTLYTTQPKVTFSIIDEKLIEEDLVSGCKISLINTEIDCGLDGYYTISDVTQDYLNYFEIAMPRNNFSTSAVKINIPNLSISHPYIDCSRSTIHGFDHVMWITASFFAQCKPMDVASFWIREIHDSKEFSVIIFDNIPGGMGFAKLLYQQRKEWLRAAYRLLAICPCSKGCKNCIYSIYCPSANKELSKQGTLILLNHLLT